MVLCECSQENVYDDKLKQKNNKVYKIIRQHVENLAETENKQNKRPQVTYQLQIIFKNREKGLLFRKKGQAWWEHVIRKCF